MSSRDQVASCVLTVTFQFYGCGTALRCKKFRVMKIHRPQLFREAFAASSARIREVFRILSLWTGRIGGKVAAVM